MQYGKIMALFDTYASSPGIELSHQPNDDETLLMLQARDRDSNL